MATRHDGLASTADQALLLDIDLAILGSPPERFAAYGRNVRSEYSWVPEAVYRGKRRQVLAGFLSQDLYRTGAARALLAEQAAANLSGAIAELSGQGGSRARGLRTDDLLHLVRLDDQPSTGRQVGRRCFDGRGSRVAAPPGRVISCCPSPP